MYQKLISISIIFIDSDHLINNKFIGRILYPQKMKNHVPLHKCNIFIVSENICCGMNMYDFDLRVFSLNEFRNQNASKLR